MRTITTINEIRKAFINYFSKRDHSVVAPAPLIPQNDPSLLFVNSGMVQFKDIFLGTEKSKNPRATSYQKCIRAGGKHNDLENVGYTSRHHTFFEMLGNFSFGDYFKEDAIFYAWDFLTKVLYLKKEKIYVTVYHTDEEAISLWKKIANLSDEKIIRISTQDNFWSMGETGPCGPCSEIFYDHGPKVRGGLPGSPEENGDRYVEFWNLVFMQYEQVNSKLKIDLPNKCIDTGMGLERIAAIIQQVSDNYYTDIFLNITNAIQQATKNKIKPSNSASYKVVADHLRSISFMIADSILPSNEGRGYVLRRIMRRCMRYANNLSEESFLSSIVPVVVENMKEAYPELSTAQNLIMQTIAEEENKFSHLLEKGLKLLKSELSQINISDKKELPGDVAFKLYDTYGFPLDLTEDILRSQNITIDHHGFTQKMQEQKELARSAWVGSGAFQDQSLWFKIKEKINTEFVGYIENKIESPVISILIEDQEVKEILSGVDYSDKKIVILTQKTPFYGESGGQNGDIGNLYNKNFHAKVIDTKKYLNALYAHIITIEYGELKVGEQLTLAIDLENRQKLRAHHSATHLLQAVIKEILGNNVSQQGSLVASNRLRFDINYNSPVNTELLQQIEYRVNQLIIQNLEVKTAIMNKDEAVKMGAIAMFGEKYEEEVRVVSMSSSVENFLSKQNEIIQYSVELCGGTHVNKTGEIGFFKIINETGIASGIRRIEALVGLDAVRYCQEQQDILSQAASALNANSNQISEKLSNLLSNTKKLEKEIQALKLQSLILSKNQIEKIGTKLNQGYLVIIESDLEDLKILRSSCEQNINRNHQLIIIITDKTKNNIILGISKDILELEPLLSAKKIIEQSFEIFKLRGGGNNSIAQAGGINDFKGLLNFIKELLLNSKN